MTPERWEEVKQLINKSFSVTDTYTEDLEPGIAEVIEFKTPHGLLRASFETRPRVLDKKTLYSHRAGGETHVDYVYSDDENVTHLKLLRWNESTEEWLPIDASSLF